MRVLAIEPDEPEGTIELTSAETPAETSAETPCRNPLQKPPPGGFCGVSAEIQPKYLIRTNTVLLLLYLNFPKLKIQKSDNFPKYKISKKYYCYNN